MASAHTAAMSALAVRLQVAGAQQQRDRVDEQTGYFLAALCCCFG